jgi:hypothetical protein
MYHSVMAVAWRGDRVTVDVRFWHLADNLTALAFVRYWGNSEHIEEEVKR